MADSRHGCLHDPPIHAPNPDVPGKKELPERKWLYQTPEQILIKASNGASDFGNKFGQPLICGSVLTFEHKEKDVFYGYDKVIMLAGGVGYGTQRDCLKGTPEAGDKIVVMGGDNYRIGLGGGSVSSVDTGRYSSGIELNAVQRANAEMQKRAYNVVRALCEEDTNPIVSIHDHGSAGHVNCLSELVEDCGGLIDMSKLPIGDHTLSAKEIIANESQERMGLLIDEKAIEHVKKIADRERAPMYEVGETTGDPPASLSNRLTACVPSTWQSTRCSVPSPKTYMVDNTVEHHYENVTYEQSKLNEYLRKRAPDGSRGLQRLVDQQGGPFRDRQSCPPAMSGRNPVATERLWCRGPRLPRRKRHRHLARARSASRSRQPCSRFRIGCS